MEHCEHHGQYNVFCPDCDAAQVEKYSKPPCVECGALTKKESETKCVCCDDKDHCHGCDLWKD